MTYQALLFDMDGVVIDTHQPVTAFWEALASQHNVQLTPAIFDQYIYGSPAIDTLDHVFPQLATSAREAVIQRLLESETNQVYAEVRGMTALLRELKRRGIATALVTSGERWKVDAVVRQLGLAGLFAVEVTAGDIRQGKPHPECYLLAAQRLQVAPERCIVFEDSINGVKAAAASGALCIGVRPAGTAAALVAVGAQHVIENFEAVRVVSNTLLLGGEYRLALSRSRE